LSEVEDRADNLWRAITAYEAALQHYTPEAAPLAYARTQANLGIALKEKGDLTGAVACWRAAERLFRLMGMTTDADLILAWIAEVEARLGGGAAPP
jgi:tetratricopeptide (TPR) repeat protein